jgi:hypothetical protein
MAVDRKSFIVGAVFGALVSAGIASLLFRPPAQPQAESGRTIVEQEEQAGRFPDSSAAEPPLQALESLPAASVDTVPPAESTAPTSGESWQDFFSAQRAALLEQPKDVSWAYYMERAMLQYLSNHGAMSQFSVDHIECRTTICQIGVEAYAESANPDWQRVIYDMRQEPWYEFGQVGSSSGAVDGRQMTVTTLHRVPDE